MPKRILVAPLNWGLGHATRCIPIIRELQKQGAEVVLASDGRALALLRQEFPALTAIVLPGYNIHYPGANMILNMTRQLPGILWAACRETQAARQLVTRHEISGIISDNRYGCHSRVVRSVFITHQLNIKVAKSGCPTPGHSPASSFLLEKIANRFNRRYLRRFDECWIPDVEGEPNLSGELGHSQAGEEPGSFKYIGALSRMHNFEVPRKYDAIAVLSGPEPQRSYLEKEIIGQARRLPFRFLVVQGKTETMVRQFIEKNIEVVSHLASEELNNALLASGVFIGRSGYSSIMDLAKTGRPAILIPTPGQTEQEYLAARFSRQGVFCVQEQGHLDLAEGLKEANRCPGLSPAFFDGGLLEQVVSDFLAKL
ncbi:MAG: glycosyltransferase [Saprospiraceae bacterium]|nr:MAG: glycosyltransferase [Saprospiraceae bacterium]